MKCFAVKLDIKKFFASVDQKILLDLIKKKINCQDTINLIEKILDSFKTVGDIGLPLGNVTSQLFANIYLNELDKFVKHNLREKYYLRFCDDFIILKNNSKFNSVIFNIDRFLAEKLHLTLKEDKIEVRKLKQGFDYLGYVILPYATALRTKTKKRIIKKISINVFDLSKGIINKEAFNQSLNSYYGILLHCRAYKIQKELKSYERIAKKS